MWKIYLILCIFTNSEFRNNGESPNGEFDRIKSCCSRTFCCCCCCKVVNAVFWLLERGKQSNDNQTCIYTNSCFILIKLLKEGQVFPKILITNAMQILKFEQGILSVVKKQKQTPIQAPERMTTPKRQTVRFTWLHLKLTTEATEKPCRVASKTCRLVVLILLSLKFLFS